MSALAEARALQVIVCKGSARERGRTHGEELRGAIEDVVARWQESLATRHGRPAEVYIAEFLAATSFIPTI